MKRCAISIVSKERAELVDVAAPEALGANELRGKTVCTLISPGTELMELYWGFLPGVSRLCGCLRHGGHRG